MVQLFNACFDISWMWLMWAAGRRWQQARDIFEEMKAARFKPDISTYTALLAAYHPAKKWRQALQVSFVLDTPAF